MTVSAFFGKSKLFAAPAVIHMISDGRSSSALKRWSMFMYRRLPSSLRYMTQSGTYEHQSTLSIGESTNCFCPAFDLSIETLNGIVVGSESSAGLENPYRLMFLQYHPPPFAALDSFMAFSFRLPGLPFLGPLLCFPENGLLSA